MKCTRCILLACLLLLAACFTSTPEPTTPETDTDVIDQPIIETKNVRYSGTVAVAGVSVYQEGTHRLMLEDGSFILLESDSADLNGYVGEAVNVQGATRPTVEEGAVIMRVESITLQNPAEEEVEETTDGEEEAETEGSDETNDNDEETTDETSDTDEETDTPEEQTDEEDTTEDKTTDTDTDEPEVILERPSVTSPSLAPKIAAMAKENIAADRWTQQYCSSHIKFCIAVHKNWWFKSFGNTSSYLWHVELSTEEITSLGDGPIMINLVSGVSPQADGTVAVEAGKAVGYRNWTDNRYFEIVADQSLEDSVAYITANLSEL